MDTTRKVRITIALEDRTVPEPGYYTVVREPVRGTCDILHRFLNRDIAIRKYHMVLDRIDTTYFDAMHRSNVFPDMHTTFYANSHKFEALVKFVGTPK